MCTDCGCAAPSPEEITGQAASRTVRVEEDLLAKNTRLAQANRQLFGEHHLLVLNLVSSPGSGKTTLLERTLTECRERFSFAVIEGDQQTANDAERIAATGAPVKQINTGAGCHLDAHMVGHALDTFALDRTEILMIENVGNLVCPASFDLGEDHKVVVLSVTEGEDKPLKYPHMFRAAELMIINKVDLLPHLQFDLAHCKRLARQVNPSIEIIELSCQSGEGLPEWYAWLAEGLMTRKRAARAAQDD